MVEYLLVGGSAVAYHGYDRQSQTSSGQFANKIDFDFWYNPTYQNYFNVLKALEELGLDVHEYRDEVTPDPHKSFFRLESDDFTLDLLPQMPGLGKFHQSFQKKAILGAGKQQIPVLSYEDLVVNKQVQGRRKDVDDIRELKRRRHKL